MSEACAGCGRPVPGGTAGCRAEFHELGARAFGDLALARRHRMIVDTYCLQHPDDFCASAKSLAAHLCGLCCAFEHGGHPSALSALRRWLDGPRPLTKPELPPTRGAVTLADVLAAPDPDARDRAVERWARSAWDAYADLHPVARRWLQDALRRRR